MSDDAVHASGETGGSAEAKPPSAAGLPDPRHWVDRHGDYLFRYVLARVRDETVAEDLVQDALLAALQAEDRFSTGASERGWLTGILKHKILDHFRRLSRERTVSEDDCLPDELQNRFDDVGFWKREPESGPADWGTDPASLLQRQEFMVALQRCLSKLPPRWADAFVLREMEEEASERIQELLGITASNFWVLLHRARMQLRLCLEQNWLNL